MVPRNMEPGDRRWAVVQAADREAWCQEKGIPSDASEYHRAILALMDADPLHRHCYRTLRR